MDAQLRLVAGCGHHAQLLKRARVCKRAALPRSSCTGRWQSSPAAVMAGMQFARGIAGALHAGCREASGGGMRTSLRCSGDMLRMVS